MQIIKKSRKKGLTKKPYHQLSNETEFVKEKGTIVGKAAKMENSALTASKRNEGDEINQKI